MALKSFIESNFLNKFIMFLHLVVEIMSDTALKLRYCKHTVTRTDVYGRILLLLQQPGDILFSCSQQLSKHIFVF